MYIWAGAFVVTMKGAELSDYFSDYTPSPHNEFRICKLFTRAGRDSVKFTIRHSGDSPGGYHVCTTTLRGEEIIDRHLESWILDAAVKLPEQDKGLSETILC